MIFAIVIFVTDEQLISYDFDLRILVVQLSIVGWNPSMHYCWRFRCTCRNTHVYGDSQLSVLCPDKSCPSIKIIWQMNVLLRATAALLH